MTAQRTFTSRIRRAEQEQYPPVTLSLDTELEVVDEEGNIVTDDNGNVIYEKTFSEAYTFNRPTDGRLLLMVASFGASGSMVDKAGEIFATLEAMLSPMDFRKLRARVDGEPEVQLDVEVLGELVISLIEEWGEGFPTQPSSASSAAPQPTGGRSTGRSPGRGSTRSSSASRGS